MKRQQTSTLAGAPALTVLVAALRQHWRTSAAFFCAVVAGALALTLITPKTYTAVAVVQLMPRAGQEFEAGSVVGNDEGGYLEARDRARTQIQVMLSRSVREETVRRYAEAGHSDLGVGDEAVEALGKWLSAGPREDTQLVELRVEHADPAQAAVLADLVAEVYFEHSLDLRRGAARDARRWLDVQLERYEADLVAATHAVLAFRKANDLAAVHEGADEVRSRLGALQRAVGEANTERVLLESQLAEHQSLLRRGDWQVLSGMVDDPALAALAREHAAVAARTAEVQARYGALHPEHQRVAQHVERVEGLLEAEVGRIVSAEQARVQTLLRQEERLSGELDAVKTELLETQRLAAELGVLERKEDQARALVTALSERGAEVDLQSRTGLSDVRVVEDARVPTRPSSPRLGLNLAVALLVGGLGGVGLALLRHRWTDAISAPLDEGAALADALDLDVLARLPPLKGEDARARARFTLDHPESYAAETSRVLRAMLHEHVLQGGKKTLLVTSAVAGEGKTTTAATLAIAFARLGARTVVVDADLRQPQIHPLFDLDRGPGLAEALIHEADPLTLVRETTVRGLRVLSAGCAVTDACELLSSPLLPHVLRRLGTDHHVVIIDSPPVGLLSDALPIAREVEGVLMVARLGRAPMSLATEAVERLKRTHAPILGLVLNGVEPPREVLLYGAGYYLEAVATRPAAR